MNRIYSQGFRKIIAWQEAKRFSLSIFEITKGFPKDERYEMVKQMRRASASVMANLAEGSAMPTVDHRNSYYARARGSVVEVDSFLELSVGLHYLTEKEAGPLHDHAARLSYLITRLASIR